MLRSRLVSDNGTGRANHTIPATQVGLQRKTPTLKRNFGLLVILLAHPVLTALALAAKLLLLSVPIGEGFGVISLLGAVQEGGLGVLNGARLSGRLMKKMTVFFDVVDAGTGEGKVVARLDPRARRSDAGINEGVRYR